MRSGHLFGMLVVALALLDGACSSDNTGTPYRGGSGGGSGGKSGQGGSTSSGGTVGPATGSGGMPGTGGRTGSGGATVDGGSTAAGGQTGSGGSTGDGGSTATVPSAGCGKTPTLTSGPQTLGSRKYIIRIPSDYNNAKPYRLIFGMHWMGGTMEDVDTGQTVAKTVWSYYGLQQLDTEHTTIFVAPNASGSIWAKSDETFVDDMVKLFEDDLCIDTSRIFSIGFSYGAIFSYSLACDRPKIFRAVATLEAAPNIGCDDGKTPVAYLGIEGLSDPTCTPTMARGCRDTFVKANGCTVPASVPEWTSGQNHVCYSYEGCKAGYPVRWCTGNFTHQAASCDTCSQSGIDGNKTWEPGEAWKFFTQF